MTPGALCLVWPHSGVPVTAIYCGDETLAGLRACVVSLGGGTQAIVAREIVTEPGGVERALERSTMALEWGRA